MGLDEKVYGFFSAFKPQSFKKGEVIIQAGADPPGVIYLLSGSIVQYDISDGGDKIIVNTFKPKAFFPMSWALNQTPNQYYFEALESVKTFICPQDEAVKFLQANPDVLLDLLKRVYRGTDGVIRRMAHLMGGTARTRLLFELQNAALRFGSQTKSGTSLNLTESQLAASTGLTRETVNREIQKLKKESLISVTPEGIVVHDPAQIQRVLADRL